MKLNWKRTARQGRAQSKAACFEIDQWTMKDKASLMIRLPGSQALIPVAERVGVAEAENLAQALFDQMLRDAGKEIEQDDRVGKLETALKEIGASAPPRWANMAYKALEK